IGPVRVGNGAWDQRQLDVYGELLDAASRLPDQLDRLGPVTRGFLADLADTAAARWREQDQGIWEVRSAPRDFLYSKLMCWVALDRAITLADRLDAGERVEAWKRTRDEIAETIRTRGWSDTAGAFTQSFGSDDLDASNLMMAIVGFLPADDPRMLATVDAIAERLTDRHGLVYRYPVRDVALALAHHGADLVLGARTKERLAEVAAEVRALGRNALVVPTDITVEDDCDRLAAVAHEDLGRIDVLVNNAFHLGPMEALDTASLDHWRTAVEVNMLGNVRM